MTPTVVIDFSPLSTPTRHRGIGRYLNTLAKGLARLNAADRGGIRLLSLVHVGFTGRFHVAEDPSVALTHPWTRQPTQLDRYRWAYARRIALWRVVRSLDARAVHLGDPNATPLGMAIGRCKRVVTCHDLIPLQFPSIYLGVRDGFGVVGKRLIVRRFRSADHVVAISDATREELIRLVGVPADRVTRVYNGVDLDDWSPTEAGDDIERVRRHGLTPGRFLLYAGDTDWRKNPDGMIRGLAGAAKLGSECTLAFVGKVEAHKIHAIRSLADRAGVTHRVFVLGYVSDADLRALYRHALAHLFLSRAEGFGYTVIEAMASGCPVITTRSGALAEVGGNAALTVDPEDTTAIGRAIRRLEGDSVLRRDLVSKGLTWANAFSCESQARGTLDVLRRIVDA